MNKIDAGSISGYTRQMVGLPATSEICGVAVCSFMLFYDGYKVEASSIHTFICHLGKLLSRLHFSIWDLFWPLLPSFFLVLSLSLFLSFSLSFIRSRVCFFLSLCVSKTHRIASFSTTRNPKAKLSQCCPLRYPEKRVSSSADRIK